MIGLCRVKLILLVSGQNCLTVPPELETCGRHTDGEVAQMLRDLVEGTRNMENDSFRIEKDEDMNLRGTVNAPTYKLTLARPRAYYQFLTPIASLPTKAILARGQKVRFGSTRTYPMRPRGLHADNMSEMV